MTEQEKIAELEAKLEALQKEEAGGVDPVIEAKARQYAKMAWNDVLTALEGAGYIDLPDSDYILMQQSLLKKKVEYLTNSNTSLTSWKV